MREGYLESRYVGVVVHFCVSVEICVAGKFADEMSKIVGLAFISWILRRFSVPEIRKEDDALEAKWPG